MIMPYCPKCGTKVDEDTVFCPKCGASIKGVQAAPSRVEYRHEKREKEEKNERDRDEKREKGEKHEKRGVGLIGPIIGGLVLIFLGLAYFLENTGVIERGVIWAFFLVAIGVIIIIGAFIGLSMAYRRNPQT
jgi:uncharacterized membrane protein YvbJ